MKTLLLLAMLAAPGDPQYDAAGGSIVLSSAQLAQVGTFISNTWSGVAVADTKRLTCLAHGASDQCAIAVLWKNQTADQVVTLFANGWQIRRKDFTRNASDDYTFTARSPTAAGAAGMRAWLDNAFGAGSGASYRRLDLTRSGSDVNAVLRVLASSTAVDWVDAWVTGAAGMFVATE